VVTSASVAQRFCSWLRLRPQKSGPASAALLVSYQRSGAASRGDGKHGIGSAIFAVLIHVPFPRQPVSASRFVPRFWSMLTTEALFAAQPCSSAMDSRRSKVLYELLIAESSRRRQIRKSARMKPSGEGLRNRWMRLRARSSAQDRNGEDIDLRSLASSSAGGGEVLLGHRRALGDSSSSTRRLARSAVCHFQTPWPGPLPRHGMNSLCRWR